MTQREVILRLLRERGPAGVSAHEMVYEKGITRGAAIVFDLKAAGYDIETVPEEPLPDGRRRLARYVLHEDLERGIVGAARANHSLLKPHPRRTQDATDCRNQPTIAVGGPVERLMPLQFPCGCVRSADGQRWNKRCERHAKEETAMLR